jgi:hypothetical protein
VRRGAPGMAGPCCSARFGLVGPLDRQWHRMACGVHAVPRGSLWGLQLVSSYDDVILEDDVRHSRTPTPFSRQPALQLAGSTASCSADAARNRGACRSGGDEGRHQADNQKTVPSSLATTPTGVALVTRRPASQH